MQDESDLPAETGSEPDDEATPALTQADWIARLYELNPWATDVFVLDDNPQFVDARRQATLARWQSPAWNDWADDMIALQEAVQAAGLMARHGPLGWAPKDEQALLHFELALADFSEHAFTSDANFEGLSFPWAALFRKAKFGSDEAPVAMKFQGADFNGPVQFDFAEFSGAAKFRSAIFRSEAWFEQTKFAESALFDNARFLNGAFFDGASFEKNTSFFRASFAGTGGRPAGQFRHAAFRGPVSFSGAHFHGQAIFLGSQSDVAFSLARAEFSQTPNFIDATFHEPPRLDDCRVPEPLSESHLFSAARDEPYPTDPRPPGLLRCFAVTRACASSERWPRTARTMRTSCCSMRTRSRRVASGSTSPARFGDPARGSGSAGCTGRCRTTGGRLRVPCWAGF